jgi:hypothetical protein
MNEIESKSLGDFQVDNPEQNIIIEVNFWLIKISFKLIINFN